MDILYLTYAHVKLKQRRFRTIRQEGEVKIFKSRMHICNITYNEEEGKLICSLSMSPNSSRKLDIHDPCMFDKLLIIFECFAWLIVETVKGNYSTADLPYVLANEFMWNKLLDCTITNNINYRPPPVSNSSL